MSRASDRRIELEKLTETNVSLSSSFSHFELSSTPKLQHNNLIRAVFSGALPLWWYSLLCRHAHIIERPNRLKRAAHSPGSTMMRVFFQIYFDGTFRLHTQYVLDVSPLRPFPAHIFPVLHFESFPWKWCRLLFRDPPASILITISTDVLMEAPNTAISPLPLVARPLTPPLFQPSFPILLFIVFSLRCPLVLFAFIRFHFEHIFFFAGNCVARRVRPPSYGVSVCVCAD